MRKQYLQLSIVWLAVIISLAAMLLTSCAGSKDVQRSASDKSQSVQELRDSFTRVLRTRDELHQRDIDDLTEQGVLFTSPCPGSTGVAKIDSTGVAKIDSVGVATYLRILPDGSIVASGPIAAAYSKKRKTESTKDISADAVDSTRYGRVQVQTVTVEKVREVEKRVRYLPIWLLLIVFVCGAVVGITGYKYYLRYRDFLIHKTQL